jgi:hypothetical protein
LQLLTWAGLAGVITGVGAFIDFYLGPPGRLRAKDWMLKWWLKIDDVQWAYFGKEEAIFAVRMMDRFFGRRFLSVRRMIVVVVSTIVVSGFMTAMMMLNHITLYSLPAFVQPPNLVLLTIILVAFAGSFSVTKIASLIVARFLGLARYVSLCGLVFLLIFQYALISYWSPAMNIVQFYIINTVLFPVSYPFIVMPMWARIQFFYYGIIQMQMLFTYNIAAHGAGLASPTRIFALFNFHGDDINPINFTLHLSAILNLIPNLTRFALAALFIGSLFLRPLKRPIMTIWERLIDSEKPFTLLFGGVATVLAVVRWIVEVA